MNTVKSFILLIALFSAWTVSARKDEALAVSEDTVCVGYDYSRAENVSAVRFRFDPYAIVSEKLDSESNLLVLQMRKVSADGKFFYQSGKVAVLDLARDSVLWSRKISFRFDNEPIRLSRENTLVYLNGKNSVCIDMRTGVSFGKSEYAQFYSPDGRIGMKWKRVDPYSNDISLTGVNLRTNEKLWKRWISARYGFDELVRGDDSTILVSAGGLHRINFYTGAGWDYSATTGTDDGTAAAIGSAVGIGLGMLTGIYSICYGADKIGGLVSNTLISDSVCYQASADVVAAVSIDDGRVLWAVFPPVEKMTCSELFETDSLICTIGHGTARRGENSYPYGRPYVAAFRKTDGRLVYAYEFGRNRKDPIRHTLTVGDDIVLVSSEKVWTYSPISGRIDLAQELDEDSLGWVEAVRYCDDCFARCCDSMHYRSLSESGGTLCLYTGFKRALVLNDRYEIVQNYPADSIPIRFDRVGGSDFVYYDGCTRRIGPDGTLRAELFAGYPDFVHGAFLYCFDKSSLLKIDLSKLLGRDWDGPQPGMDGRMADNSLNGKKN